MRGLCHTHDLSGLLLEPMHPLLPSLTAACLYAAVAGYQGLCLAKRLQPNRRLLISGGVLALLAHGLTLIQHLFTPEGLHLNFFTASSLIAASVIFLILMALRRMPVETLLLPLFPLSALTVLLAQFAPVGTASPITEEPGMLAHILLSVLAYGIFTIAAVQAVLLLIQNHHLKHKHPTGLIRSFPPLQTMENLLFSFLWAGWIVLCASLLSGWMFVDNLLAQHLVHKTLLSLFAWLVFGLLLAAHHYLGWRGPTAIRWTLGGFCLLMLAYFGTKLVREFILHI